MIKLRKKHLKKWAKLYGVEGYKRMSKKQLRNAIRAKLTVIPNCVRCFASESGEIITIEFSEPVR